MLYDSPRLVTMMIGTFCKASCLRISRQASNPFILGMTTSIRTRSGASTRSGSSSLGVSPVFTVALADLTGRLPLMKVSDRLTDIAELIIQCCMDLAWQQMTDVYGVPYCGDQEAALRPVRHVGHELVRALSAAARAVVAPAVRSGAMQIPARLRQRALDR